MNDNKNLSIPTYAQKPGIRKTWPAFVLLISTLLLTFFGWKTVSEEIDSKIQTLFETENAKVINRLSSGIERHLEVLRSFQNLYAKNIEVVKDVFWLFATVPTNMYEGIQSIAYAPHILRGKEGMYSEYVRNEGYQNYTIKPAGIRHEYYPVEHIIPYEKNSSASSLDILVRERHKEAIEMARDSGYITASYLVPLLCSNEPGFLFVAPLYFRGAVLHDVKERRDSIQGVIFMELRAMQFIKSVLGKESDTSVIAYSIYDGSGLDTNSLIFSKGSPEKPLLQKQHSLNVAGRPWVINFSTLPGFAGNININLPWFVLGGGLALSFLLFGFTFSLLTSRSHAIDLAARITRSQRRIVDSSQDMICVVGFDGTFRSMNPASKHVLGFAPHEMIDKSLISFTYQADRKLLQRTIVEGNDERPTSAEIRFFDKEGNVKWINWSITFSNKDQMIYMIGRDITEKKKAEEQIRSKSRQLEIANIITERENDKNEEFLKTQSLEFRTQLTSIVGFLQILMSEQDKYSEEEKEFLNMAYSGAENLFNSVKEVLDISYAKISDVSFAIHYFKIDEVMNKVEKLSKLRAEEKGATLLIKTPPSNAPRVNADPQKLIQSLMILIDNLLNYYTEGNLRLQAIPLPELDVMEIILSDSGLHNIPDIFQNIDPSIKKISLTDKAFSIFIAKSFIEVMGGTISFSSNSEGFSVNIKLPLAK